MKEKFFSIERSKGYLDIKIGRFILTLEKDDWLGYLSLEITFEYRTYISDNPKDKLQEEVATNLYYKSRRIGKVYVDPIYGFIEEGRLKKQIRGIEDEHKSTN